MDINGGRLSFDALIKDSDFKKQIAAMEQRIVGLTQTSERESQKMDKIFTNLGGALAAFLTISQAQNFVSQLIRVRSEFQQLEIAFTTMLGSKEKADQLTKELIEFASTTPFGMKDTANAAKQLLAYGSSAESVRQELTMLGDVASGVSQPIGELVYLYGTLRMQGRAYQQDINQFANRGIPIYKELANVLKINENEVRSFVEAGKVGFAEVQQAFQNMTAEGSMFGGLMEAQSKTIAGDLERLGDAFEQALNEIGQSSEGLISTSIQGLSLMVENYQKIIDILTILVVTYGSYKAAVMATTAIQAIATTTTQGWTVATMLQYRALVIAEGAQKLLNRTMLANPYVLAATALGALTVTLFKFSNHLTTAERAQKRLDDITEEANKSIAGQIVEVEDLIKVAKDETKSKNERYDAIKKLNSISPDYLGALDLETIGTQKATDAVNLYIEALKDKAFEQAAFNERVRIQQEKFEVERSGGTNWIQRAGMSLYGLTGGDKSAMEAAAKKAALDVLDAQEKALDEELKKRNQTKTKVEDAQNFVTNYEQLKKINQEIIAQEAELKKALAPDAVYNKAKIESIKDTISNLKGQRDLLMGVSKDAQKASSELKKYQEEHASLLQKIYDKAEEVRSRNLTDNERELAQTRKFYSDLRKELEEFNKESKGPKISQSIFDRLNQLEEQDMGSLLAMFDVEKRVGLYNEDYQNYLKYTELKEKIGEEFANKELGSFKNVIVEIQNEINALLGKKYTVGLSASEEKYLDELTSIHDDYNRNRKEKDRNNLAELLAQYATFEDKRKAIINKAEKDIAKLRAEGKEDQVKEVQKQTKEELENLYASEIEGSEVFQQMLKDLDDVGSDLALRTLKHGQDAIKNLIKGMKITDQEKKALTDMFDDWFGKAIGNAEYGNSQNVIQLVDGFSSLVDMAVRFDGSMANTFRTIGAMVNQAGELTKTIGSLFKDSGESIGKTGGVVGAILGSVFSLMGTYIDIVQAKNQKKLEEQKYQNEAQIRQMDAVTKVLEKQLDLINEIYGVERIKEYQRVREEAEKSINDTISDLNENNYLKTGDVKNDRALYTINQYGGDREAMQERLNDLQRRINNRKWIPFDFGLNKLKDEAILLDQALNLMDNGTYENFKFGFTSMKDITRKDILEMEKLIAEGKLDEITEAKVRNIIDQYGIWRDATNRLNEEITGSSLDSLINDVSSIFFSAGEDAADAFGKGFDKIMEAYMISAFKREFLGPAMQEFYDTYAEMAIDGLDADEVNQLKRLYQDNIVDPGNALVDDLTSITGTDPRTNSGAEQNKFKGRINPGMTEQQANQAYAIDLRKIDLMSVIISEIQGVKYQNEGNIQSNQLLLMQGQMDALNSIRDNTGATVVKLEEISQKTDVAILELKGIKQNTTSKVGRNSYNGG